MSPTRAIGFLAVGALCASGAIIAADPPPSPLASCRPVHANDFFPAAARRLGLYGTVTVSFEINQQGRIDHTVVLASDSKYFTPAALTMLKGAQCEVPSQLPDSAGRRYTVDIEYLLTPCERLPKSEQAEAVLAYVCGSVIPGSHPTRGHGD
jgi:TonB family protein